MANRVWIELDVPKDKDNAQAICKSANQMLGKLVPGLGSPSVGAFFLSGHGCYCFGGDFGYEELEDNGKWFNLDTLGA